MKGLRSIVMFAAVALALTPTRASYADTAGLAPGNGTAGVSGAALMQANQHANQGEWGDVQRLATAVLAGAPSKGDQAEAHRLLGLAAFYLQAFDQAEGEFVAYLKLDLDGRLDPALIAPEAVTFFESVRARHAGELRALRPRPKRNWALNLLPPLGQFQNQERIKGIVLGSSLFVLAATNVTTYFVLRSWCGSTSRVCDESGVDHTGAAKQLRTLNYVSGVAAIGTFVYGVIDGTRGYRRRTHQLQFAVTADETTTGFVVAGRF